MRVFLNQETPSSRKPPRDVVTALQDGAEQGLQDFHPLDFQVEVTVHPDDPEIRHLVERRIDCVATARWGSETERFAVEYKHSSTPKSVESAVAQVTYLAQIAGLRPMVIVPYLSEDRLEFLEGRGISGLDLCGNGVVVGERFRVFRTGRPNRYRTSAPLKNVYRGSSSVFARAFLLQERFGSLGELFGFVESRSPSQPTPSAPKRSKGTGSKVVQGLVDDLIVAKAPDGLTLLDAPALLAALRENHRPLGPQRVEVKTSLSVEECWARLRAERGRGGMNAVTTGLGSAPRYGALSMSERTMLYVQNLERALELLEARPTSVFPNLRLVETTSDLAYFDARDDGDRVWASPIQTWLELVTGGAREREAAQGLESDLARGMAGR